MKLEDITNDDRIAGIETGQSVTVFQTNWIGDDALQVYYKRGDGSLGEQMLQRSQEAALSVAQEAAPWSFEADPKDFKLAAENRRNRWRQWGEGEVQHDQVFTSIQPSALTRVPGRREDLHLERIPATVGAIRQLELVESKPIGTRSDQKGSRFSGRPAKNNEAGADGFPFPHDKVGTQGLAPLGNDRPPDGRGMHGRVFWRGVVVGTERRVGTTADQAGC